MAMMSSSFVFSTRRSCALRTAAAQHSHGASFAEVRTEIKGGCLVRPAHRANFPVSCNTRFLSAPAHHSGYAGRREALSVNKP